jgi:hypothetical protein
MKSRSIILALACLMIVGAERSAFVADFQQSPPGALPESEFMVLNGQFEVKEAGGQTFVELPGEPIDSFGFLAGPEGATAMEARVRGQNTGKRFPEFGVGLGGAAGYRLWVMPAVKQVQIVKNEQVVAHAPLAWKAGAWTHLKFQARSAGAGKWVFEGKAWNEGEKEPEKWLIAFEAGDENLKEGVKGRASAWGTPYSSQPIAFDDLKIR